MTDARRWNGRQLGMCARRFGAERRVARQQHLDLLVADRWPARVIHAGIVARLSRQATAHIQREIGLGRFIFTV